MKIFPLLPALFCLCLAGCGEKDREEPRDDPKTTDKTLSEALDWSQIQPRGQDNEKRIYAPDSQVPFTGWIKKTTNAGQADFMIRCEDGKLGRLWNGWEETEQEEQIEQTEQTEQEE